MQELVQDINEKFKPSGWYNQLHIFFESSDFSNIIAQLKKKVDEDKQRFCPSLGRAFRFMKEVSPEEVKVIMLIDYISNRLDQSDGVALSTGRPRQDFMDLGPIPIFQSINDEKHNANNWVKQGVLILPLALTSRIGGKPHKKIWEPFIMRMIEAINTVNPYAPWLLMGSDTWKYEEDIKSPHTRRIELKNPLDDREWHQWVNNVLNRQRKGSITW